MRVGIDFRPAMFSRTGFGRYVLELARALASRDDVDLSLFGDAFRSFDHEERVIAAVRGTRARLFRSRFPGRLLNLLSRFGYAADTRLGGVDVFHYTDFVFPPVKRAPIVATVHDLSFEVDESWHGPEFRASVHPRLARILARASRVIVPGVETRERLERHYGFDPSRVDVVPYGSEHLAAVVPNPDLARARLSRLGIDEATPFVLNVGTIEPRKNHLRLLRAFEPMMRDLPHHLLIVGGFGWRCDVVRTELARLASTRRIHVIEDASDAELRALYDQAAFAIYPSLYEGFGFPAVEAMACGVPLITSRGGSLGEVVGDGAEFCDPEREESIAAAMLRVATDESLREELIRRGSRRAAKLSWERCAAGHVASYSRAVADPSPVTR